MARGVIPNQEPRHFRSLHPGVWRGRPDLCPGLARWFASSTKGKPAHFMAGNRADLHCARSLSPNQNKVYELTTERLKTTEGVFSKVTDTLELYRVKDLETRQPFWSRMCGLEDVDVNTSDLSTPFVRIDSVPIALGLGDKIRNAVENVRLQKRVREIDIE